MLIINNEEFHPTNYDGYFASKSGKIYSIQSGKILKGKIDKDGYIEYCLTVDNKRIYKRGHRIIAETFIPNPYNKEQVNHKDKNTQNNAVSNLEWNTCSENNLHRWNDLEDVHADKWLLFEDGQLIKRYKSTSEAVRDGISIRYLNSLKDNEINYNYLYFEKTKTTLNVYFNGEVIYEFSSNKEASEFFGKKPNTIASKNTHHTKTQIFTKKYKLLLENSNDYRKHVI